VRRAVVVFFVLALTAALVGGCTGSSGTNATSTPDVASARAVLARMAVAVRQHDRKAFLAAIDPAPSSAAFRAEQRQEFVNRANVPLAEWNYTVVGRIADRQAIVAARARYRVAPLLLHVTVQYRLRGIDSLASRHELYLVFVRRGGSTVLAGDDALAGQSTNSWLGPWHYGPLAAARGRASLVLGPSNDTALLHTLAGEVDSAVGAVTAVWGRAWSQRVAVIVPASAAEFTALTGSGVRDVSAAAVTEGLDPASGRPYGQRLVLNPEQLGTLTPVGRGIVLRHEITHLATATATADITPRWLVEGLADYVGNRGSGQDVRTAAAELHVAVAGGRLPAQLPTDSAFAASGAGLARAYEQSWLACRLIAQRAGQSGLLTFYRAVGAALAPRAQAVAAAFARVLHESQASFTRQWRAYLKDLLS
jgi:hypothetical protein